MYHSVAEKYSHQDGWNHVRHEACVWTRCVHRNSQVYVLSSCHPVQQPHSWSGVWSWIILWNLSSRSSAGFGGQTRCHPRKTWEAQVRCWGLQEIFRNTCSMCLQHNISSTSKMMLIISSSLLQMLLLTRKLVSYASLFPSFHFLPSTRLTLQNSDLRSLGSQ